VARTIGTGLAAHIASGRTKLSRCVLLELRDGTVLGLTDHDENLSVDLGDGAQTYSASVGALPSAITLGIGLDADNLEIRGPISDTMTAQAVLGGRFHRAVVRVFDVRWDATGSFARLLAGKVTSAKVEGGAFILEIRSNADAFNQTIGRTISPSCSHDHGQGQCAATPTTWAATVATVTDDMRFSVTWTGDTPTADDIRNGTVEFDTGELAGCLPIEVFNLSGAAIELYQPLVEAPQVGDTLTVTEGCDKLRTTCKLKGQILNFGGFPDLTGTDAYVKFPNPGG
jgi:uncharacterized phage protein (TIGR02218 family)